MLLLLLLCFWFLILVCSLTCLSVCCVLSLFYSVETNLGGKRQTKNVFPTFDFVVCPDCPNLGARFWLKLRRASSPPPRLTQGAPCVTLRSTPRPAPRPWPQRDGREDDEGVAACWLNSCSDMARAERRPPCRAPRPPPVAGGSPSAPADRCSSRRDMAQQAAARPRTQKKIQARGPRWLRPGADRFGTPPAVELGCTCWGPAL